MIKTVLTQDQINDLLEGVLRASGSRLGNYSYKKSLDDLDSAMRAIESAVLASPEVVGMRRNTLLSVLGNLNSNPYSLTKSECIDLVRDMFEEADAAMKEQKP